MNQETRIKYINYIASGIRFAMDETGLDWPPDTIIITKHWHELAKIDDLLDYEIFVTNIESADNFNLAFKSYYEKEYSLLKAFNEYLQMTPMED